MEKKSFMKYGFWCVLICLSIGLASCSKAEVNPLGVQADVEAEEDRDKDMDTFAEEDKGMEAFADEDSIRQCMEAAYADEELQDGLAYCMFLMGDTLYYWTGVTRGRMLGNVHIWQKTGEESAVVEIAAWRDKVLLSCLADREQCLYYLYLKGEEEEFSMFLQKDAPDGSVIYDVPVPAEVQEQILEDFYQEGYIYQTGTVSLDGTLVLGSYIGTFYLFDEKGNFLCSGRDCWNREKRFSLDEGILNAGDGGVFTYEVKDGQLLLAEIDLKNGELGAVIRVTLNTAVTLPVPGGEIYVEKNRSAPGSAETLSVFSGYERGILVSDNRSLWQYDPAEEKACKLFDWNDSDPGMENCVIDSIGVLEDGRFYVRAYREGRSVDKYIP